MSKGHSTFWNIGSIGKISWDNHRSHCALPERVFGRSVFLYPQLDQ